MRDDGGTLFDDVSIVFDGAQAVGISIRTRTSTRTVGQPEYTAQPGRVRVLCSIRGVGEPIAVTIERLDQHLPTALLALPIMFEPNAGR
mgnify:CR=1 FL=1